MFSRIRPLLKVYSFKNAVRNCQSQAAIERFLKDIKDLPPKGGYSSLFFDKEVQKLLRKVSNIDLKIVFKQKPRGTSLSPPVYKLLTTEELQEELKAAEKRAEKLLQIPPLINVTEDKFKILDPDTSLDGYDEHHSKHVFVDVSPKKHNEKRAIVVREPNGVLRTALREERRRANQVFNPIPGREIETPEMFLFENLLDVIKRKEYEFILDRACAQFEPDDPQYHETITLTYEAINFCSDFAMLYSTRHFGSLVFYLVTHKNIDNLLNFNIQNDRIEDAFSVVQLYHLIHPECKSAESQDESDMKNLENFINFESKEKNILKRSLDFYIRKEQSQRELKQGIREAHGL